MSWQDYVDNHLIGTGKIAQAAIYGIDGSLWATSPGFSAQPAELDAVKQGFQDASSLQANGVFINNVKYFTIYAMDRSIYGKKDKDGIVIVKTTQAILIGTYIDPTQPGEAATIVEKLADYLISLGYWKSSRILLGFSPSIFSSLSYEYPPIDITNFYNDSSYGVKL